MSGSSLSFISCAVSENKSVNHLFVLEDKEAAAFFYNDLNNLLEKKDIHFFPDSFKRPGKLDELNNNNMMMRTETINKLAHSTSSSELIVSYPEALFEKVVRSELLYGHSIEIKIGEHLDTDDLIEKLQQHKFELVDFVYEAGQFSIRGGIIDIFSYGNDFPYRIELFDREVESIRNFDPGNQLSTRKIASVSIVPNIQTDFTINEKTSVLEELRNSTVLWIKDLASLKEALNNCLEKAQIFYDGSDTLELIERHPLREGTPQEVFEDPDKVIKLMLDFPLIECTNNPVIKNSTGIAFNTEPQPSFNKQFDFLIKNIKELEADGYQCLIFSDNAKQIERFYNIFEDLDAGITFTPFYKAIHQGFIDHDLKIAFYTDHQIFNRYHKYRLKQGFSKDKALLQKQLGELQPGDYVTHIDHGIGVYSGLEKIEINRHIQESVRIKYADNDLLYVSIQSLHKISKYSGKDGKVPRINKLGSDSWNKLKKRTKRKIKDIAEDLIKLYAKRKAQRGFAFTPDSYLQSELEASFVYEDTPDQNKATIDVKQDMEREMPMDRLICGDVGFGKTEVAIRAAFKSVADSKQVAVLVPTTILAMQHFQTFKERLEDFPCNIEFINRFKSTRQKNEIFKKLKDGSIDIIIGTHALVSKNVEFKDLGLLIIDEEQKFGVSVKEKLKEIKINVDTLTLTATPIPRTLQFSMMGTRDMSIIQTPPPNRQPIQTEVYTFDPDVIRESIEYEVYRGGQVFFVHNRVKDILEVRSMLQRILPNIDIAVAHGQMDGKNLENVMLAFVNREYDVLLCTSIIEAGLDIPNANTIIINNAHMFGLSDLHQLRGRVGRSNKKAFCYLFRPPVSTLTKEARQRLKTIEEFASLGSGINIAMRDLDIRGAGNLLGAEQSGFIAEIGYDVYHKILDEAINELKENEFKDLYKEEILQKKQFIQDCQIETDLDMLIPDEYVRNINERLSLYTELNNTKNEKELDDFRSSLVDRFGTVPVEVYELFNAIRLKWLAIQLGFEKILFSNNTLRCYFIENKESPYYESMIFGSILEYIQSHPGDISLKQTEKNLVLKIKNVDSMHLAYEKLEFIRNFIEKRSNAAEEAKAS